MKKFILCIFTLLSLTQAIAVEGINLDSVDYIGECGKTRLKGTAIKTGIKGHFVGNVSVSISGKEIFTTEDQNHAIGFDYMSTNCTDIQGKKRLVITGNCTGHSEICGKEMYYILDSETGGLIAPQSIKNQKTLCDGRCASKILGRDWVESIEKKWRD